MVISSKIRQLCQNRQCLSIISQQATPLSTKPTIKTVQARGTVFVGDKLFKTITNHGWHHTIDFSKAQLAGIDAVTNTSTLFPSLRHNIKFDTVGMRITLDHKSKSVIITSSVKCSQKHDANTEAMTAVAVTALTIYDMGKELNQNVYIKNIEILSLNETNGKNIKYRSKDLTPNNVKPVVGTL